MCVATKGHFTHEPRAVTVKLWEPKRKCPKAVVPTHLQIHKVWSRTLECSVKSYVTGAFNQMLFQWVLIHAGLQTWYQRMNQRLWAFGVSWSPSFMFKATCKRWFLKIIQVTMKHDSFDAIYVGIHVDFTSIILHTLTPGVPRASSEVSLDRFLLFHQWECLKCNGHGLAVSCVKWP
jgi:hypothetical protein